jgi:ABC-2 type transport system permease protein
MSELLSRAPSPARHVPRSGSVLAAFLYLSARTLRNRARVQLRRLRTPRQAVALVVGVAYFWYFLVRPARGGGFGASVLGGDWALLLASVGLALLVAKWWLFGADPRALAFTPAEVQFLFPAPVSRRGLVHYKLLRAQLFILVNTVIWSVLLRGGGTELSAWLRAAALWMLFSTLYLHRLGAALSTASAVGHGAAGRRRHALPIAVFSAGFIAVAYGFALEAPLLSRAWSFGYVSFFESAADVLRTPVPWAVLLPFRTLVAPTFALAPAVWVQMILPAALIMLVHYLWVLRTDATFEEAALEASARRAAELAAHGTRPAAGGAAIGDAVQPTGRARRLHRWSPRLAPVGPPAVALVWKNVVAATRADSLVRQLGLFAVMVTAAAAFSFSGDRLSSLAAGVAAAWGALLVVAGPLWVRFDLRHDLPRIDVLRALPLHGREVVAAEIASSALLLTVFQWVLLVAMLVATAGNRALPLTPSDRLAVALALALVLPAVNAVSLTIQNAAALLFPGWVRLSAGPRGVEAMGQNMMSTVASFLLLLVGLLVPMAGAVAMLVAFRPLLGLWSLLPAAVAATAIVGAELYPIVVWLGRVFEKTDSAAIG